jgi:WD40 repeat protein
LRGDAARIIDLQLSPDGTLLGSLYLDGELVVWDPTTGRRLHQLDTLHAYGFAFSPNNRLVHSGGPDAMLRTWDLLGMDSYVSYTMKAGRKAYVHADVSPDGRRVAYSWLDRRGTGRVRFVDVVARTVTRATPVPLDRDPRWASGAWHPSGAEYVAYCPVMCAGGGRPVWIDPVTGRARRGPTLRGTRALSLAYVDGGRSLVAGRADFTTTVVDAHSLRRRVARLAVAADCCVAPVGDGRTAVAFEFSRAEPGGTQWRAIDVRSGNVGAQGLVDLLVHTSAVSADGSTVAVAGDTGEIVTIRLATGEERRSAPLSPVYWLSYSDDGELLVSGAANGGVSLWDATTLELLGTVHPPRQGDPVPSGAEFIGDTHDVAIASYDGSVYRWDTDLDHALDFACQMAGRDLTEEEWAQYLPTQPYQSVCPQD